MIILKAFNLQLKRHVQLVITDDGLILGLDTWKNIRSGSVKRYSDHKDMTGKLLFEDDIVKNEMDGSELIIRYGHYEAYCPEDGCAMPNTGFYAESAGRMDMPLGPMEEYAIYIQEEGEVRKTE